MNSQVLLVISLGLIIVFALIFWRLTRAAPSPTLLRLKRGFLSTAFARAHPDSEVKNLNVVFMHNGHSFDAYEVLGVPAGSSLPAIEEAYRKALKNTYGRPVEFIEAAYQAIVKAQS